MYVIFPADEVVYLSYGRLIYIPQVKGPRTDSSSNANTQLDNQSSNPSAPSTSNNSSTRSFHSVVGKPSPSSCKEELPESFKTTDNHKEALKSNNCVPIKPQRTKKKQISFSEKDLLKPDAVEICPFLRNPKDRVAPSSTTNKKLQYLNHSSAYQRNEDENQISVTTPSETLAAEKTVTSRINLARTLEREGSFRVTETPQSNPNLLFKKQNSLFETNLKNLPKVNRAKSVKSPEKSFIDRENTPVNSTRAKSECEHRSVSKKTDAKLSVRGSPPNTKFKDKSLSSESRQLLTEPKQLTPEKTPPIRRNFFGGARARRTLGTTTAMATIESPLRELTHPSHNEILKAHNAVTFKLVRTVSDFTQQLGQFYEQHAEELQLLVSNFKKKNLELRKERPACPSSLFHTWETLLQEVEIDSQALGDIASILGRQISRPLLERSFCRKIQSRKVFTHRESYETIVAKTEEKLAKCRQEYKAAYLSYLSTPTTESLSAYFNNHNAYVQQLHATNGMLEEYGKETLPQLLQELDEIYNDLCSSVSDAILQGAEVVSSRAIERHKRYDSLVNQCRAVSGSSDLANLVRSLPAPQGRALGIKKLFVAPQPPAPELLDGADPAELQNENIPPPLKDELVIDRLSAVQVLPAHDALRKESSDLEGQIRQIHDALENLLRIQQRSLESALYNKANELQEDISMKRFDLRVAQIHLSAINSQKELFLHKLEGPDSNRERKMSTVSTGSMKTKWLKAFKSLKTPPPSASPKETEKKNGSAATRDLPRTDPDAHNFQENTYKKITPCDVCSQILRGHTRQGLKCRFCKMNIHVDCQDKAPKCQPKSRLLRRQKSTSEIESRVPEATVEEESLEDETISRMSTINRQLSFKDNNVLKSQEKLLDPRRGYIERMQGASNMESSSMRRRLFAGMKSLTGFGSRSRQGSPSHRSISLPEKRRSQDASGTRPFGEPLCLTPQIENGNSHELLPPTPPSPSPSKGKLVNNKRNKNKK